MQSIRGLANIPKNASFQRNQLDFKPLYFFSYAQIKTTANPLHFSLSVQLLLFLPSSPRYPPIFFFSLLLPIPLLTVQQKGLHLRPPPWQGGSVLCHTSHVAHSYRSHPPTPTTCCHLLSVQRNIRISLGPKGLQYATIIGIGFVVK